MNVDFITAIKLFFANYANFRGRSTRAEYWWAMLGIFVISCILSFLKWETLNGLFSLAVIIPNYAIMTRRFHDAGYSGWVVLALIFANIIAAALWGFALGSAVLSALTDPTALLNIISSHIVLIGLGGLISLAAGIIALVILVRPSVPDNQYGPNPYGEDTDGYTTIQ